jgi:hypothetical protein
MSLDPLHTPGNLNWDPASVDLPEIPMIPPGEDAMSMTIAGVLPTLTAPMAASVAALQAKETMFSGKLGEATSAYQNADDSGGQQVGQLGQMLGQFGQMAQQAGAPAQALGGQAGQFGSMMQQAMQAAQGGGSHGGGAQGAGAPTAAQQAGGQPAAGGQSSGGSAGAGGSTAAGAAPQQARDGGEDHDRSQDQRDDREKDRERLDSAAPGPATHGGGPAPVAPPEHPRHQDGEDLGRRV